MNDLTQHQKDILIAFANNDMKIHRVAKQLNYSRNTIEYHLNAVKNVTGLDPRTFHGLTALMFTLASEKLMQAYTARMRDTVDELCADAARILFGEGKPEN